MCVFFVRVPGGPGGVVFVKDILMRCFEINVIEPDQDVFNVVSIFNEELFAAVHTGGRGSFMCAMHAAQRQRAGQTSNG